MCVQGGGGGGDGGGWQRTVDDDDRGRLGTVGDWGTAGDGTSNMS